MKRGILITAVMLMLAACETQPTTAAEQKAEERRLECLNNAERVGNPPHKIKAARRNHLHKDTPETKRLKEICRKQVEAD